MNINELIDKYQSYIDSLDFYGLYKALLKNGDYSSSEDLMHEIDTELGQELSLYHQANSLGFKEFDDLGIYDALDRYSIKQTFQFKSIIDSVRLFTNLGIIFDKQLEYILDDLDPIEPDDLLDKLDINNVKSLKSVRISIVPFEAIGLRCIVQFEFNDYSPITFCLKIPNHEDWYYGFIELGGAFNTQAAQVYCHKIKTIVLDEIASV